MGSYRPAIDQLVGKVGIIVERVPAERSGRGIVKVGGQLWTCETDAIDPIDQDTAVWICGRNGLRLLVLAQVEP
jgi:membrane protein implicated in regulation of membrane protease activity